MKSYIIGMFVLLAMVVPVYSGTILNMDAPYTLQTDPLNDFLDGLVPAPAPPPVVLDVEKMKKDFAKLRPNIPALLVGFCGVQNASGTIIKYVTKNEDEDAHCYILTAKHVVFTDDKVDANITVRFYAFHADDTLHSFVVCPAELVHDGDDLDYAVLKAVVPIGLRAVKTVVPMDSQKHKIGSKVFAVGRPASKHYWVNHGHVAYKGVLEIGHDAGIWYGFSGGPLMNSQNIQIGVNVSIGFAQGRPIEKVGNALPLNLIYNRLGDEKVKLYFGHQLDKADD